MRCLITLVYFLLFSISAQAASVYVSDNLRVGVRTEPDNAYTPVGVVLTGMKLEVLDKRDGHLKVRTPDNLVGWIKEIYVVDKEPAIIKLQHLQNQYDKLKKQVGQQEENVRLLEESNSALNEQIENLKKERNQLQLIQAKTLQQQGSTDTTWIWALFAMISIIVGGFIGGIQWYRHQAMKRLGGLRV